MEEKKVNSAPDGQAEEEQLIEQAKIRRDKLQKLQSEGKNPYGHTKYEAVSYTHLSRIPPGLALP